MVACYKCGKAIKGQCVRTNPPIYLQRLGIDFPKAFHQACYAQAEREAEAALKGGAK